MNKNEKNKPTILITTSTFPRSETDTIPRFVLDLAQSVQDNYQIIVLTPHMLGCPESEIYGQVQVERYKYFPERYESLIGEGGILPRIKQNPVRILQIPFLLFAQYIAVKKIVQKCNVRLIHAQWFFPQAPIAMLIANKGSIRFGVTSHGSDINQLKSPIFQKIYQKVIRKADFITAVSESLADKIQQLESTEVSVIPMGINQGFFEVRRSKVDSQSIISVGRLDRQKGFQDVIKALPEIPKYHYTIIGEGSDRKFFEELAKKHGVQDRVYLVGSKTPGEIMQLYQTAGLFILPSRTEGFGLSVVEAMASGIPVITSDIEALSVHTKKGDGISVNTQDISQLKSAIEQVDKVNSQKAQEYARAYSWQSVGHKFSTLYHNTLNT